MNRRRFLIIAAAASLASPARAGTTRWRGTALGADATITLRGPKAEAAHALAMARQVLDDADALFSLYRPDSVIAKLNRIGRLHAPARFAHLLALCDRIHHATGGKFDPTVQPLWKALALGGDLDAARALIGWDRVKFDPLRLAPGQQLTLNGIAQGYATDMVSEVLAQQGYSETLINIGEFRAGDGLWKVGIEDPNYGLIRSATLTHHAIATSSPLATRVGAQPHILSPDGGPPRWNTISVEAKSATIADGFSTAFCVMHLNEIEGALRSNTGISRVTLVDGDGDIRVLKL